MLSESQKSVLRFYLSNYKNVIQLDKQMGTVSVKFDISHKLFSDSRYIKDFCYDLGNQKHLNRLSKHINELLIIVDDATYFLPDIKLEVVKYIKTFLYELDAESIKKPSIIKKLITSVESRYPNT